MYNLAIIVTACNFHLTPVGADHQPVCKEVIAYEQQSEYAITPMQCLTFAQQQIAYKWCDDPKNADWQIVKITCNPNYKPKVET